MDAEAEARVTGSDGQVGKFAQSLADKDSFSVTWELAPGRGAFERSHELLMTRAERAAKSGSIHAVSLADDPGGSPALSAAMLGGEINRLGIEPLVHLTCKNKNRNELESMLYGLERSAVRNLLVMTGDYPKAGYMGGAKPVFDLDPVTLLGLIRDLNAGRCVAGFGEKRRLKPTHFNAGVVTSPFKLSEAEQMGQYYKLKKKLCTGAQFVISQFGYDARKMHELPLVVKMLGYGHVPVLGNIYLLPLQPAKLRRICGLPGCRVPGELVEQIVCDSTTPGRGKSRQLERGARMYALLKGMGFRGAYIGGVISYDDLEVILGRGEELTKNWRDFIPEFTYPQPNGWYYFELDPKTGLNSDVPVYRQKHHRAGVWYNSLRILHKIAFEKDGLLFSPLRAIAEAVDGSSLEHTFTRLEHVAKDITVECVHCGDCALPELAYLCPASQCAKNQRNGPCGGSHEGWCEQFPREKKCIYVHAYERLQAHGSADQLGRTVIPPVDNELNQTSSWLNFFLGRDHAAKSVGIPTVPRRRRSTDAS